MADGNHRNAIQSQPEDSRSAKEVIYQINDFIQSSNETASEHNKSVKEEKNQKEDKNNNNDLSEDEIKAIIQNQHQGSIQHKRQISKLELKQKDDRFSQLLNDNLF